MELKFSAAAIHEKPKSEPIALSLTEGEVSTLGLFFTIVNRMGLQRKLMVAEEDADPIIHAVRRYPLLPGASPEPYSHTLYSLEALRQLVATYAWQGRDAFGHPIRGMEAVRPDIAGSAHALMSAIMERVYSGNDGSEDRTERMDAELAAMALGTPDSANE